MIKRRIKRQTLKYKLSESEKLEMNSTICVVFFNNKRWRSTYVSLNPRTDD